MSSFRSQPSAPPEKEISVRHLTWSMDGWSVAETTNFRVFHRQMPDLAVRVACIAEKTRAACCRKWFGAVDEDWSPRCDIYLHATADDYSRSTGVSALVPGFSTTDCQDGRVTLRRIDLQYGVANLLRAVLPHEVTHAVMAGKFGDQPLPPWANEAMAVLTEPDDIIAVHTSELPRHRRQQRLLPVARLMESRDYPPSHLVRAFHAQSISLVQMLVEEKGPQGFAHFLRDATRQGYEAALKRHYGCNFAGLEQRWRYHAFADEQAPAATVADRSMP